MKCKKLNLFVLFFGGFLFRVAFVNAQSNQPRIPEKSFYYLPELQLIASQLDGDNASGYHKFGFLAQVNLGWKQNQEQSWELSIGFSERGSRRGYNPDIPGLNPFHIRYRSVETSINYRFPLYSIKESWDIPLDLLAGLRMGRLIQIEDTERYALYLDEVYRPYTISLEVGARYPVNDHWALSVRANYSAVSMLKKGASSNPLYPTGVYNNAIGLGFIYVP